LRPAWKSAQSPPQANIGNGAKLMANDGSVDILRVYGSDREILDIIERFRAKTLPKER